MQIQRLTLRNFRQHAATDLTFGPGVTVIAGPNGAGKSTILEALAWAIYGSSAARGTRDFLLWNRAPARAKLEVGLTFTLGGRTYRVDRTLSSATLHEDGVATTTGAKEVTDRLETLLGLSRTEFFQTYFTGQKDLAAFQAMGPTDRARFLSRVMGYDRLKEGQDRVRSQRNALRSELAGVESALGDEADVRATLATAREAETTAHDALTTAQAASAAGAKAVAVAEPVWTAWQQKRESAQRAERERREAQERAGTLALEIDQIAKELASIDQAADRLAEIAPQMATLPMLRAERDGWDVEAETAVRQARRTAERQALTEQLAATEATIAGLVEAPAQLAEMETSLSALRAAHDEQVEARRAEQASVTARRAAVVVRVKDLTTELARIRAAGHGGACPTCQRALAAEYDQVVGRLAAEHLSGQNEILDLDRHLDALRVLPDALADLAHQIRDVGARGVALQRDVHAMELAQTTAATLRGKLAALPGASSVSLYDAARHADVRAQVRALEGLVAEEARLQAQVGRRAAVSADQARRRQDLTEAETLVQNLGTALQNVGYDDAGFEAVRRALADAQEAAHRAHIAQAAAERDAVAAVRARQGAEARWSEWQARAERRADLVRQVLVHDALDQALTDLRADLNTQLRPELADRASQCLADLTDGRYAELELSETYDLVILEAGEPKPVISGGEEDLAHLVLRLAIAQLVAERAGQPLSLLVLDEIFGSLDSDRRDHVMALLKALAGRFPQVILITHVETIRQADRMLHVTFDGEKAVVEAA